MWQWIEWLWHFYCLSSTSCSDNFNCLRVSVPQWLRVFLSVPQFLSSAVSQSFRKSQWFNISCFSCMSQCLSWSEFPTNLILHPQLRPSPDFDHGAIHNDGWSCLKQRVYAQCFTYLGYFIMITKETTRAHTRSLQGLACLYNNNNPSISCPLHALPP